MRGVQNNIKKIVNILQDFWWLYLSYIKTIHDYRLPA